MCLGISVLELSKLFMYEFYCHKMQPNHNNKTKLRYMDTDSFIFSIKTKNFLKGLENFKNDFEFSELDKNLKLYKKSYR